MLENQHESDDDDDDGGGGGKCQGRSDGGGWVYRYIYPPKIRPSKLFME